MHKLDPAILLTYESGRVEKRRYWDISPTDPQANDGNGWSGTTNYGNYSQLRMW